MSVTSVVTFKHAQSGHLLRHKRRFHLPQSQLPFKCFECPSSFAQKWDLDIHNLTHKKGLEAWPYECPKCGCAFTQPSSLSRHLNKVDCTGNCKCNECGKELNSAGHLRVHMRNTHAKGKLNPNPNPNLVVYTTMNVSRHVL